jgi:hypothetical protein
MKKTTLAALVVAVLGCIAPLTAGTASAQAPSAELATAAPPAVPADPGAAAGESLAQAAMKNAADAQKYLYLFVSEKDSEETATARLAVEAAAAKLGDRAQLAFIKRDSAAEKDVVEKFGLNRAPLPIVLAIAPNGAITGAYFAEKLKDPQLQDALASVGEQQCMKSLQSGRLVFLCAQNGATKNNDAAMQGVNDFKADARFAEFTDIVKIDPSAEADKAFLAKLQIDPTVTEAITAFLAPPGALVSKVSGATSKDALVAALTAATSGGCGPGACGPKGCGPVKK